MSINSGDQLSRSVTVLALYGINADPITMQRGVDTCLAWFTACGCIPDRGGVMTSAGPSRATSFPSLEKRLRKEGLTDVLSVEFQHMRRDWKSPGEYRIESLIRRDAGYAVLAVDSALASLPELVASDTCRELISLFRPQYGIGYERCRDLGPTLYAIGLSMGAAFDGPEYEEALRISRWRDMGIPQRVFAHGLVRDIYPFSWLNRSELSARVAGVTLEYWIEQDPRRGHLGSVEHGLRRWDVEPDRIYEIRDALWNAGLIFDSQRHHDIGRIPAE